MDFFPLTTFLIREGNAFFFFQNIICLMLWGIPILRATLNVFAKCSRGCLYFRGYVYSRVYVLHFWQKINIRKGMYFLKNQSMNYGLSKSAKNQPFFFFFLNQVGMQKLAICNPNFLNLKACLKIQVRKLPSFIAFMEVPNMTLD